MPLGKICTRYLLRQPLLLNLVSYADYHGIRRRPYYIQESSELLENVMTAYIVRNFFGGRRLFGRHTNRTIP